MLNKLHTLAIKDRVPGGEFKNDIAYDEVGNRWMHLTNLFLFQRPLYELAVPAWKGEGKFAICETAYGANDRMIASAIGFYIHAGRRGFDNVNPGNLSAFWRHISEVEAQAIADFKLVEQLRNPSKWSVK